MEVIMQLLEFQEKLSALPDNLAKNPIWQDSK
jgi:hypothetical protein